MEEQQRPLSTWTTGENTSAKTASVIDGQPERGRPRGARRYVKLSTLSAVFRTPHLQIKSQITQDDSN